MPTFVNGEGGIFFAPTVSHLTWMEIVGIDVHIDPQKKKNLTKSQKSDTLNTSTRNEVCFVKRIFAVLLSVTLLMMAVPMGAIPVFAATSGTTGDCTWVLDGTHLTISGNGAMGDYDYNESPWGTDITSATIEEGVTSVGDYAFCECNALLSVDIPDSVTIIESYAFAFCTSITSVTIPNSVTTIEFGAFESCSALAELTIGDRVDTIGDYAFCGCTSLTEATIPASVTVIGENIFAWCFAMTNILVKEENVQFSSVDGVLFDKNQTTLLRCPIGRAGVYTIPEGVIAIENSAFSGCITLTEVTVPDNVVVGKYAFFECEALTTVTIGDDVTLGDGVFGECRALTSLTIGDRVTIGQEEMPWGYDTSLSITIGNDAIIASYAFYGTCVTSLTIGDGYTIGESAFEACNLTTLTLGKGLSIGDRAFASCSALSSAITIPEGVVIGADAFSGCTSLSSVTIGDDVVIGRVAFSGCELLRSVSIADGVNIGDHAFRGCRTLKEITIGDDGVCAVDSVAAIGDYAFERCDSLTTVTIGGGYPAIGNLAFESCKSLVTVTIGDGVTTIGDGAFYYCESLVTVDIPNSVTTIGKEAFSDCQSLIAVDIPDSVTNIGEYAFSACCSLQSLNIPNSINTIKKGTFCCCESLTTVTIPDSVTTIEDVAFAGSYSLKSLFLPDSVTTVGDDAFEDSSFRFDVYYAGSEADKNKISIGVEHITGLLLSGTTWHYNWYEPYRSTVTHSVMDTDNGTGLAFRFTLRASGVTMDENYVADYTNATIHHQGVEGKVIAAGAVLTNLADIGADEATMTLDSVDNDFVVDIPATYLQETAEDFCAFAARIINIPAWALDQTVYARPYCIIEVGGERITVYGDIDSAACNDYL